MQGMQQVFNSRMETVQTHAEYPRYARSETKPVIRARHIIDNGVISDHPCSICVELEQDCFRWEGAFGKCAYCTSKDKKQELCHLPGQEASPAPERRRKRRKITGNIYAPGGYAASNADTMMSGTLVSDTLPSGPTPFRSAIQMSGTRSVRKRADPASAMTETIATRVVPPSASEAGSQATLERVTALENQVSTLEAKVLELLVKLEEVSSCVSTTSTPRPQAAAGASPTISSVTFEDLQAQQLVDAPPPVGVPIAVCRATRDWVEGPQLPDASSSVQVATSVKVEEPKLLDASQVAASGRVKEPKTSPTPEHTFEHPEGYRPVNCSCATSVSLETDAVLP